MCHVEPELYLYSDWRCYILEYPDIYALIQSLLVDCNTFLKSKVLYKGNQDLEAPAAHYILIVNNIIYFDL